MALAVVAILACSGFQSDDGLARERSDDSDSNAAKNAWEGKAPPSLDMELWMNAPMSKRSIRSSWSINGIRKETGQNGTTELDWEVLKGKVVILDFWAYW